MLKFAYSFIREANKYKNQSWEITKFEIDDAYLYVKLKEERTHIDGKSKSTNI